MDQFAWMKSGSDLDGTATGSTSVAVADLTAHRDGPDFVYSPWKMKDVRRLYVNLQDGAKIGYLDLATMEAFPESAGTGELLQRALAGLSTLSAARRLNAVEQMGEVRELPPKPSVLPWDDLAASRPGQRIENRDDASYRAGVAGEQRTAGVLASLEREGYRVLHSVPLSSRKDIDHLVIGPNGIWAINTKTSSYEVVAKANGAVYSDGYRQKWIESLARDAGLAGEYLARAARMDLAVQPLVAVWSTIGVSSSSPHVVAGDDLCTAITEGAPALPAAWVEVVYNVARRSDTWTANH